MCISEILLNRMVRYSKRSSVLRLEITGIVSQLEFGFEQTLFEIFVVQRREIKGGMLIT